jgi:hypothetical protein
MSEPDETTRESEETTGDALTTLVIYVVFATLSVLFLYGVVYIASVAWHAGATR